MIKNFLKLSFSLLLPMSAFAAAGSGPFPTVYYQIFNLSLVLLAIGYFTRTAIIQFFKSRQEEYLSQAEKTLRLKREAEKKLRDIEQRLYLLEKTKSDSIDKAKSEAAMLKEKMLLEAQTTAQRLKKEAEAAASAEVQRAKNQLLQTMTAQALDQAQVILSKDISGADQGRLQEALVQQLT